MKKDLKEGLRAFKASYLKKNFDGSVIESFRDSLYQYYTLIDSGRDREEEYLKNITNDFLKNTFYAYPYMINTARRIDSAITKDDKTLAFFEFKRPTNSNEMIQLNNINKRALHEAVFYYLGERINNANLDLKKIIITDTINWFIFDSQDFGRIFYSSLNKIYKDFTDSKLAIYKNEEFFSQVIQPFFESKKDELDYIYFNLDEICKKKNNITEIKFLYKIFNPDFLMKEYNPQDTNVLNKNFYNELLYIMGLKEKTEQNKTLIVRDTELNNSFLDVVYNKLITEKNITEKDAEDVALELVISWVNRILFIKLFESQLILFNNNNSAFEILNTEKIQSFKDLNNLFIQVLNKRNRDAEYKKFDYIPYLNSSLFEISDYEDRYFAVSSIDNNSIKVKERSNLKNWGKYQKGYTPKLLEYLLDFLKSYNFSTHIENDLITENKEIINASVLGLIFEKINGYKDGAVYTPGLITEYMAKESIEKVFIDKFNEKYSQNCKKLDEVRFIIQTQFNSIDKRKEVSELINSIRICDPAVGSGHFLVSALNQLIAIKYYLGVIFKYQTNDILNEYEISVEDDILTIMDGEVKPFVYDKRSKLSQQIQQTLFNEKKVLIENCLFGVDINSKSVQICRLRLWIELLKNAYYNADGTMETLPNIDINIKYGNSLISRIPYKVGEKIIKGVTDNSLIELIKEYKNAVKKYKDPDTVDNAKEFKRLVNNRIQEIKQTIAGRFTQQLTLLNLQDFKDPNKVTKNKKIKETYSEAIFKNSMEWAIEFPEILDDNGTFLGFDIIIANPPYIDSEEMVKSQAEVRNYCTEKYLSAKGNWDLFIMFSELALKLGHENSINTYIVPNKILAAKYSEAIRNIFQTKSIIEIRDYSRLNIFSDVRVYPITYILKNHLNVEGEVKMTKINNDFGIEIQNKIPRQIFIKDILWDKYFQEETIISILLKICQNNSLNTFGVDINASATVNEAYALKEYVRDDKAFDPNQNKKLINSGVIDKYISLWGYKPVQYIKNQYLSPTIENNLISLINQVRLNQANSNKIIIANMTKELEAYYDEGEYLSGKSTTIITGNRDFLKYLISLLNSKLITFWYKINYNSLKMSGEALNFASNELGNIPIIQADADKQQTLISYVDKILGLTKQNNYFKDEQLQKQVSDYQKEIDKLVYKLYNLDDEEIKIIDEA